MPIFNCKFLFLLWCCKNSLCIPDASPWPGTRIANISAQCVWPLKPSFLCHPANPYLSDLHRHRISTSTPAVHQVHFYCKEVPHMGSSSVLLLKVPTSHPLPLAQRHDKGPHAGLSLPEHFLLVSTAPTRSTPVYLVCFFIPTHKTQNPAGLFRSNQTPSPIALSGAGQSLPKEPGNSGRSTWFIEVRFGNGPLAGKRKEGGGEAGETRTCKNRPMYH